MQVKAEKDADKVNVPEFISTPTKTARDTTGFDLRSLQSMALSPAVSPGPELGSCTPKPHPEGYWMEGLNVTQGLFSDPQPLWL